MKCPECSRELDADARFCDVCRTPIGYTGATEHLVSTPVQAHSDRERRIVLYSFDGTEPIMDKRPE